MPRLPLGQQKRSEFSRARFTPTEKSLIDKARGALSETDYIRRLVLQDLRTKGLL